MVFSSFIFLLLFLPVVFFLYFVVCRKSLKQRNYLLLAASLLFYAWGEPAFVFVMLACIAVNWAFGNLCLKQVGEKQRKTAFILTLIADLGLLAFYKYTDFIVINLNRLLPFDIPQPGIILPIGISFFTFQALSYTIDLYRNAVKPQPKISYVALYISLFPQLIAGPIVRYQTIEEELDRRSISSEDFWTGVARFIIGLGKKVIIANEISQAANFIFQENYLTLSAATAWVGAAAYGLQIYFDFSGYSDMAIGLGRMFGFHFLENFNSPYIARSVSDFWRRWHISLSTWFRDYVYFPLGGSRVKSKARLVFNLFVVWTLTGLWHGAGWNYIGWGLLFFFSISFEKVTGFGRVTERLPVIGSLYTLAVVLAGWAIFRAPGGSYAFNYLRSMALLSGNPLIGSDTFTIMREYALIWVIGILGCLPVVKVISASRIVRIKGVAFFKWVYLIFILFLSFILISGGNFNPFIYFNF
jgi:D-alanyl-lipoteichoic acid acyltransferase DltB (MBOAT superfamily)